MSEFERASPPSPRRRAWPTARLALAVLGAVALVAGAYLSTRPGGESKPAPLAAEPGTLLRVHDAPRSLPDIVFEDGQGRRRTLAGFRGRIVLLNIWATWCVPCREEMPALDRLQQKLGGPGFEVLALSIDADGVAAVKRFYDEIGIRALAIYVDPAMRATGSLAIVGVPTTLLIDRQGRELGRRTGPAQWDSAEAVRTITAYLDAGAKP